MTATGTSQATDAEVDALLKAVQPPWATSCSWNWAGEVYWNHDVELVRPDDRTVPLTIVRLDTLSVDGRTVEEVGTTKVWMLTPGAELEDSPDFVEVLGHTLVHLAQLARVGA